MSKNKIGRGEKFDYNVLFKFQIGITLFTHYQFFRKFVFFHAFNIKVCRGYKFATLRLD